MLRATRPASARGSTANSANHVRHIGLRSVCSSATLWSYGVVTAAAFFDLDRTLLQSASGRVFGKYLEAEGLGTGAHLPGAGLVVALYDLFGETQLNMAATKQFVRTANGWPVEAVERAARNAAVELAEAVPAYAKLIIESHHENGVRLVMATTTPTVLVTPLAERLGFDDVIATEWAHDGDEFDGTTVGPFVWGPKKRDAVVAWAEENGIDLTESYAYSDSYYDGSMLDTVGHPVAVNPDARLAAVAALQGWEIRHFDAPPGVLKIIGREFQDLLRPFTRTDFVPTVSWSFAGLENVPAEGSAILAFNHRSYFDTVAMQFLIAKIGRPCRFLAKKELFETPLLGQIARLAGGIKVDRGTGSTEPLQHAVEALRAGEMVALAPQGTIPRGLEFFDPVLKGRPGVAKLAKDSRALVLPVALWGTEKVWPRNTKVPKVDLLHRPSVSVTVGSPVELKYGEATADTERIMSAISALLPDEANQPYEPTEAELARTFPAGHSS